ncbi:hypothetical protein ANTPLA_LOCUS8712 [Anthophora plagiata]
MDNSQFKKPGLGGKLERKEKKSAEVEGKEKSGEEKGEALTMPGPSSEAGGRDGGRGELASDSSASIYGQPKVRLVDLFKEGDRGRPVARRGRSSSRSRSSSVQGPRDTSVCRTEDGDADTDGSDMLFDPLHKRKRGRPTTTGEYAGLAAAKRQYLELAASVEKMEKAAEAEKAAGDTPGPSRSAKPLPEEEEIAESLRQLPTGDIAAQVLDHLKEVERIAGTSRNLQGVFVRRLRLAARTVAAATTEVVKRTESSGPTPFLEADNARLRCKVEDLEAQVNKLRAEVEASRARRRATSPEVGTRKETTPPRASRDRGGVSIPPTTRGSVRRAAQIEESAKHAPSRPDRDQSLINKIGSLVEGKLEAFRREVLGRGQGLRPLGLRRGVLQATTQSGTEGERSDAPQRILQKKKKKKNKRISGGVTATETEEELPPPRRQKPKGVNPRAQTSGGASASEAGPRETWATVVGRKAAKKKKAFAPPISKAPDKGATTVGGAGGKAGPAKTSPPRKRLGRVPRTAAVSLTVPPGGSVSYAQALASAREKINLAEVGITEVRPKRAVTGGLLLQIPGPEGAAKADALASKLKEALEGTGVKIARPCKRGELRVTGLDDSVTPKEVADAIAAAGACPPEEVRTGQIRSAPSGLGTLWVSCPLLAANTVAKGGRIRVGWTSARVEVLAARPLQCYRCLQYGHVRQRCTGDADRSSRCYNCGGSGHTAGQCPAEAPNCPLCSDLGRPAGHRLGSKACSPPTGKKKGAKKAPSNGQPAKRMEEKRPREGTQGRATLERCPSEKSATPAAAAEEEEATGRRGLPEQAGPAREEGREEAMVTD